MKVLLDENLPHQLRPLLTGHDVFTVQYLGWSGTKNGHLLTLAAAANFDLLITMDDGVPYQQNHRTLPIALIILSAPSNDLIDLLPLVPELQRLLPTIIPRSITFIPPRIS